MGSSAADSVGPRARPDQVDERIRRAGIAYEQSVFGGHAGLLAAADRDLNGVEADLAVARGRLMHTRFLLRRDEAGEPVTEPGELPLFERARDLYRGLGDVGGEAEALFWIGCYHQVVGRDDAAAVPALELASQAGAKSTMSEVLRHLGIHAHAAGQG